MLKMFLNKETFFIIIIYIRVVVHANWLECIYVCVVLMLNWTWTKLLQVVALFIVHHLHFQRWFTSEILNLRLFIGFFYNNKRQGNWCYRAHHLYDITWAPTSFVQKVSTIMCKLQFNSFLLLWRNEQKLQLIRSKD
jgi:hypothetical protein